MIEFLKKISEKWNVSSAIAELLYNSFRKGDTPYYLTEYCPEVAVELSLTLVGEVFDYLAQLEELATKKKRVLNALKKAGKHTPTAQKRIEVCTSSFELDDILLPLRPNPRSRAQLALKKDLGPLADHIMRQEDHGMAIESLAREYVGKDPSLRSVDEVITNVKDILIERFAYDETVRAVVRDFAYEDGFFEVTLKNKHDARFSRYAGKQLVIRELNKKELLFLLSAEKKKEVRIKLSLQLFRISELLRHHFIHNPDFSGFDLLCEIIDESWVRFLQPIVDRDVKARLFAEAEEWGEQQIAPELEKKYADDETRGPILFIDAAHPKVFYLIVLNGNGDLLGATVEKKPHEGKTFSYERLRQYYFRYHPVRIVIRENPQVAEAETLLEQILPEGHAEQELAIERFDPGQSPVHPEDAPWIKNKYESLLDDNMRRLYGVGLLYIKPLRLLPHIGTEFYSIHALQHLISFERFQKILDRIITNAVLCKGVLLKDIVDSPLAAFTMVAPSLMQSIRTADIKEPLASKNDLLKIAGMTEVAFRNIAGFVILPQSEDPRDRSCVHPDQYLLLEDAAEQLNVSLDTLMSEPEMLRSFAVEDFVHKAFIEKKLIGQARTGLRQPRSISSKLKKKFKLSELKEGTVVSGRVTNITQFGVFVNINAVCDGLIHISQLADEYVETPGQVVALHDKVDVRILRVDVKKRRISLSMKNCGKKGPRVRPTQGQLNTLAEYFNKR
ncbi:MAG: S1 RNA-binding domain-containing protein [Chitinispirillaceae bacterium]|nr:S1 RNA-binding domain-containing protein [Chitinispirillaceae bacterium]